MSFPDRSNCLLKLNSELFLCAQVILYRAKKDTKYTTVLCCPLILRCSYYDDDDDDGGGDGDDDVELSSSLCAWDYLSINPALSRC